jgi:hypothetical protein
MEYRIRDASRAWRERMLRPDLKLRSEERILGQKVSY